MAKRPLRKMMQSQPCPQRTEAQKAEAERMLADAWQMATQPGNHQVLRLTPDCFLKMAARSLVDFAESGPSLGAESSWQVVVAADSQGNQSFHLKETLKSFDARTCPSGHTWFELGGIRWVIAERWDGRRANQDGHNLLARNTEAPSLARWMHPDELDHLWRLGLVTVEDQ